jgi:hypothetical protein
MIEPPVAAAPTSESTAKMVEALRAHQNAPADDRLTLADLTLVAVASATQQVAASQAPPTVAAASTGGGGGAGTSRAAGGAEQNLEAEQREIEELARQVLDEVRSLVEISRERSGDPWH